MNREPYPRPPQQPPRRESPTAGRGTPPAGKANKDIERVWSGAGPIQEDDPVAAYLKSRGLDLANRWPSALRYHPRLAYFDGTPGAPAYYPGMVAEVRTPDGQLATLHRTYLRRDGVGKADVTEPQKLMRLSAPGALRGAAVHFFPAERVLAVAEG